MPISACVCWDRPCRSLPDSAHARAFSHSSATRRAPVRAPAMVRGFVAVGCRFLSRGEHFRGWAAPFERARASEKARGREHPCGAQCCRWSTVLECGDELPSSRRGLASRARVGVARGACGAATSGLRDRGRSLAAPGCTGRALECAGEARGASRRDRSRRGVWSPLPGSVASSGGRRDLPNPVKSRQIHPKPVTDWWGRPARMPAVQAGRVSGQECPPRRGSGRA